MTALTLKLALLGAALLVHASTHTLHAAPLTGRMPAPWGGPTAASAGVNTGTNRTRLECGAASLPGCVSKCPTGGAYAACFAGCVANCDKPARVLFIGNSLTFWNRGTETHVAALAAAAGHTVVAEERTIGGATLGTLWRSTGNNSPRNLIASGNYDVVVMQEDMPELQPRSVPAGIEPFYEYARMFDEAIRATGATPIFYMAWEFQRLSWINQDDISAAHMQMWRERNINSAPVGDSWVLANELFPGRWDFLSGDKEHQSWLGTYIASCGLFAQLFGETPAGLDYIPSGSGIGADEALALQRIAWDATELWNLARGQGSRHVANNATALA